MHESTTVISGNSVVTVHRNHYGSESEYQGAVQSLLSEGYQLVSLSPRLAKVQSLLSESAKGIERLEKLTSKW